MPQLVSPDLSFSTRSRNDIARFLNRRGLIDEGVEVGVARGNFSSVILDSWQGKKLHLVDCSRPQDKFNYQDIHNVDQAKHEQKPAASSVATEAA